MFTHYFFDFAKKQFFRKMAKNGKNMCPKSIDISGQVCSIKTKITPKDVPENLVHRLQILLKSDLVF